MFRIPKNCPERISSEVRAAFSLYWHDLSSCLNHLRIAVELLLTDMGINRYAKKKDGRRSRLSLHKRIDLARSKQPKLIDLCDDLLAVKWLGNEGSHPGDVTRGAVFDALDILEHVLRERFDKPRSAIAKISKAINRRKGPR